jgi:hypothetical protein
MVRRGLPQDHAARCPLKPCHIRPAARRDVVRSDRPRRDALNRLDRTLPHQANAYPATDKLSGLPGDQRGTPAVPATTACRIRCLLLACSPGEPSMRGHTPRQAESSRHDVACQAVTWVRGSDRWPIAAEGPGPSEPDGNGPCHPGSVGCPLAVEGRPWSGRTRNRAR